MKQEINRFTAHTNCPPGEYLTIFTNSSSAEASGDALDFLSNGFKQRNTGAEANGSGDTYIYMAFAESPLVNSNGVPTNAR